MILAIERLQILAGQQEPDSWLTPPVVAALLVANLIPAMAQMVLIARRVALKRAAKSPIGSRSRLHVRLVAFFSLIASVRFICPKSAVGCIRGRDRQATQGRHPGLAPNTFTYHALIAGTSCG